MVSAGEGFGPCLRSCIWSTDLTGLLCTGIRAKNLPGACAPYNRI